MLPMAGSNNCSGRWAAVDMPTNGEKEKDWFLSQWWKERQEIFLNV
jgi:hypothetical protein